MDREKLLTALKLAEPALASKDIIVELTHFWFDKEHVTASNDRGLGIRVPCEEGLKGSLPGKLLIELLTHCKVPDITFGEAEGKHKLEFQAKRTKATLTHYPLKTIEEIYGKQNRSWLLDPSELKGKTFKLTDEFLIALGRVLVSTSRGGSATPEENGVTIIPKKDRLHLFASDNDTLSWAYCDAIEGWPSGNITMPTAFVQQLIEASKGQKTRLCIGKDFLYAKSDRMMVFSNPVRIDDPLDLLSIADKATKGATFATIPERLKLALARSFAMLSGEKEHRLSFKVKERTLWVDTKSGNGKLKDKLGLDKPMPDVETVLDPAFLKRALTIGCEQMSISKKSIVLSADKFIHIIATVGDKQ